MESPAFTNTLRTSPWATPSPRFGRINSDTPAAFCLLPPALADGGVQFLAVDAEVLDGLGDNIGAYLLLLHQCVERRQRDEARIDLKEVTQGGARITAAESVGAERLQPLRQPAIDRIGKHFQVVGR